MKKPFFDKLVIHAKHPLEDALPDPEKPAVNVGTREHPKKYLSIYGGYDTETTTVRAPEGYRSAVYSHAFTLSNCNECHVYLFRTWDDFNAFIQKIIEYYGLCSEQRIILWVANLSFEFSFLARRYAWEEVFAKEVRQPLLASYHGIDFRECLSISGGSLAMLAKNYCVTQKLKGDLDYKQLRNYDTEITSAERAYIINDVVILAEYSHYLYKSIIRPRRTIPMTSTGILISNVKRRWKVLSKKLGIGDDYKDFICSNYPDHDTYFLWFQYLFRGGYVHACAPFANIDLKPEDGRGVRMKDITSSYPYVMLANYVPRGSFRRVAYDRKYLKSHCCILYVTFHNIRITTYHTIESRNKIINAVNAEWDNGRLIKADEISVILTELDLDIYVRFMCWDSATVTDCFISERSTLPVFLLDNLLEAYIEKSRLKSEGLSETTQYHIQKASVNTHYGACVKRVRLDTITFEGGEWIKKIHDKDFEKEKTKTLLLPQWGIWITAHARHNLLTTVHALDLAGVQVVYCDTDSIKYIQRTETDRIRADRIFRKYNLKVEKILKKRRYRSKYLAGMGAFDDETKGKSIRFKTLGAKRYIYYDHVKNDIKATVAGMPKTSIKALGDSLDHIFEMFSDAGFCLTIEDSGKLRPDYTDTAYDIYVSGQWMHEESGCALVEVPFTVTLKDEYIAYIHQAQDAIRNGGAL